MSGAFGTGADRDGGGGFLREAGPDGVVLTGPDGEELRPGWQSLVITHPAHLADLDELREHAERLGVRQHLLRLGRDVHRKPAAVRGNAFTAYAGRRIRKQPVHWARRDPLHTTGGYVVRDLVSGGEPVQARYWVGAGRARETVETGDLVWVDARERILPLAEVDDVAWSEGVRMAEHVCDIMRHRHEERGLGAPGRRTTGSPRRPRPGTACSAAGRGGGDRQTLHK